MLQLKKILIDQWHFVWANYYLSQTSVSCQILHSTTYLNAQGFANSLLSGCLVFADKHHPPLARSGFHIYLCYTDIQGLIAS